MYVLNYDTSKYRLNIYCNTTMHAKYIVKVLACIKIHTNTYQHVLACIELVFGMYEIIIRANTNQINAYYFNTCQHELQYIRQYDPNTIKYRPIQALIQTKTTTNTDQNKHQYRQMHTSSFLINAPVHANTGIGAVKSGAPARIPRTVRTRFYRCVRGI